MSSGHKTRVRLVAVTLMFAFVGACTDSVSYDTESSGLPTDFDLTGMMSNYADNIIVPNYQSFATKTADLSGASGSVANYCSAIASGNETAMRTSVRAAWTNTMSNWQQAEMLLVGPATNDAGAMRNQIHSYGTTSPLSSCAVDQAVVLNHQGGFDINQQSLNSRGLGTLEYLLFNDNLGHTCPAQITETQTWNALSDDERKSQRCNYAQAVANDLDTSANKLLSSWQASVGNYRAEFVAASNANDNLKALSDALFYIEKEVKDSKLGVPSGINANCSQAACPESVESPYSKSSLQNIRANLVAFQIAFDGGNGLGFDDILIARDMPTLASSFIERSQAAIDLIDATNTALVDQAQTIIDSGDRSGCVNSAANPDTVVVVSACSLYSLIKRITDSLRIEFIAAVGLRLPDRVQSDND